MLDCPSRLLLFFWNAGGNPNRVCVLFRAYITLRAKPFSGLRRTGPSTPAERPRGSIAEGGCVTLLSTRSSGLKFQVRPQQRQRRRKKTQRGEKRKKKGRALERKCAKAQWFYVSRSPRRRPAVGSKRGLLMFQPYLCKSHFAVQSQWLIARSRCLSLSLSFTLCSFPTHSPVYLASISRISFFHYLCRLISGTSFPLPLAFFQPECTKKKEIGKKKKKKKQSARPPVWSCAVGAALETEKPGIASA